MTIDNLNLLPHLAADYMRHVGWAQGAEVDADGHVCLTGALRLCSPVPGDGYLAREVFRRRGRAESWNDAPGRTADEVIDYLASSEITDTELEDTFGPQWREIVAQVRAISGASREQLDRLAAVWDAAGDAAWDAAWAAAWAAARAAARDAAWAAAWAAARALSIRDLIGTANYTQEMYELLTAPWRNVMGPLHPDDGPLPAGLLADGGDKA
nr:MAG TPA_asm: hypothetical protein [Caudoviricetes sp.]